MRNNGRTAMMLRGLRLSAWPSRGGAAYRRLVACAPRCAGVGRAPAGRGSAGGIPAAAIAAPGAARAAATHRPARSQHLQRPPREQRPPAQQGGGSEEQPVRYGPLDVDLQPRDQLRPLLPTWNPPPTRPPKPEELAVSTRLRLKFEDRWWAAAVREVGEDPSGLVKVGYDGWPSRHDEWLPRDSDRLYLHESFHADYKDPPMPQRFERPVLLDEEGNPLPAAPRAARPRVFDPEKERLKRALRPPLPYNPEKERLKRLLRGQHAPPLDEEPPSQRRSFDDEPRQAQAATPVSRSVSDAASTAASDPGFGAASSSGATAAAATAAPASPAAAAAAAAAPRAPDPVQWVEVAPSGAGTGASGPPSPRTFRHTASGEVRQGAPMSGWVELMAEGGARYYWNVESGVTQWTRPQ